jgi:hypothetical protein
VGVAACATEGSNVRAAVSTVIGLGRLVDFIIRDPQGQRLRLTSQSKQWLAWKPDTRDLVVLRPRNGQVQLAKRGAALRHQQFHGAAPEKARPMEWPAPRGAVRPLGLIESVTYTATGIRSPSKRGLRWIHQFGDRGEHGHGPTQAVTPSAFSELLMPRLDVDAVGNLFVARLFGNQFTVQDWIIG